MSNRITSSADAVHAAVLKASPDPANLLKLWSVDSEPIAPPTLWDGIAGCQGGAHHIVVTVSRCQPGSQHGNKEAAVTVPQWSVANNGL